MKASSGTKVLALAIVLTLLFPVPAALAAPAAARIEGRVFDTDLVSPAAGLAVQAYAEGAKAPLVTALTGKDGRFRLGAVPAGNYVLVLADGAGKPLAAAPVATKSGQRAKVNLALAPAQSSTGGQKGFFQSTGGAIVTIVASAVVLALLADSLLDEDEAPPPAPVSPSGV